MSDDERRKWDVRYAGAVASTELRPRPWLVSLDARLAHRGDALEVACGAGHNAVWLARRGLDVVALDISATGLARVEALAAAHAVEVETRCADLDVADPPIEAGRYAVITCFYYLNRGLAPALAGGLEPGGLLALELPGRPNLTRHARPSARFLVDPGELPGWFPGLQILTEINAWEDDRYVCRLLATKG